MSRSQALLETALETLEQSTPTAIYQWVQHIDGEYSRHRYPELLCHHLLQHKLPLHQQRALIAVIEAMKLATQLQLHTHSRRVLMAAACCRALKDELNYWQQQGVKQPLWCAAFWQNSLIRQSDHYYFCQWVLTLADAQLQQREDQLRLLLLGPQRSRYWLFAQQRCLPSTIATGAKLVNLTNGAERYLLTASAEHWLTFDSELQKLEKINANTCYQWQLSDSAPSNKVLTQLDYIRALNQNLPAQHFKAPKPLLTAIKRYTAGTGALEPIIAYIQQRPLLAESIRQAAAGQSLPANDPWRMDLKHLYLWLGGSKASIVLATASLQQQFLQQRVPLQQSLMQRLNLLTELLNGLSQQTQVTLPTPAALLTLLTAADLFREPQLLRAPQWPQVKQLAGLSKQSWLGLPASTNTAVKELRLSKQLIKRWQLDTQLAPLIEQQSQPLALLVGLADLLVADTFHPQATLSQQAQQQRQQALATLSLTESMIKAIVQQAIQRCNPYCPLTELSQSKTSHSA